MSRKRASIRLQLLFDGDYIELDDVLSYTKQWLEAGFYDRDDLRGFRSEGRVELLGDDQPDFLVTAHPDEVAWRVENWDADQWNPGTKRTTRDHAVVERDRLKKKYPGMKFRIVHQVTTHQTDED